MMLTVHRLARRAGCAAILATLPLLGGCDMVVLNAAGDVARQQGDLVLISTGLMLLIILPVMALTALFAWRYRAANAQATYDPEWDHSTQLELVIWTAPLAIIICLGALTWVGTHLLDPYRPLSRAAPGRPLAQDARPLEVQVVALDWKWLFIYPEQGIATVNELAAPLDRPLRFKISASSVMNSFYIPALAGQIYAMPGMETTLHAVFNEPGTFQGFSANYSGAGFSSMRFKAKSMTPADFDRWTAQVRERGPSLDRAVYLALERPSERDPVRYFGRVERGLFNAVVNMCVEPGKMCMHDMMKLDAQGGTGRAGAYSLRALSYDKLAARGSAPISANASGVMMVAAMCAPRVAAAARTADAGPIDLSPLRGAGLARPGAARPPYLIAARDTPARPAL